MPAKRIPWFKVWVGATRHAKIVTLSDRAFRVWVELMDAASEQSVRGRFASYEAAAAIIRRKAAEVRLVAAAGLMNEVDGGVWMHDWKDWQRWRPEDALNGDPTTPDDLSNDTRTTTDEHTNVNGITHEEPSRAAEGAKTEKGEGRSKNAPNGATQPPIPKPNRSAEVIDAIRALGQEATMTARDHAAVKGSTAKPELIAEVYCAVFRGDYGDPFMQRHLSVHEAIGWIDVYRSWKSGAVPRPGKPSPSAQPHHIIDRTGVEN